jgi:acyl-CoA reductase-like NAD-dependent aldehyde dehydrogenase
MFVADEIYDRFVDRFVARVEAMRMAADFSFDTDMGSLISPAQLATVTTHVDDAVRGGRPSWPEGALVLTWARCSTSRPCCATSRRA